ncbi:hypothetical protein BBP40_001851 [Aspergillus hancockii]|nr:hypothetical protein BBP40_001851 [Aspergillus hancockii]
MHKLGRKARSKTGCRTCRIRKVKCDEEKLPVEGQDEPQCRRCSAARILCEWKGEPIPRKSSKKSQAAQTISGFTRPARRSLDFFQAPSPYSGVSLLPGQGPGQDLQAANSLSLSVFDRSCLDYLRDSALVTLLGKHWPWSTISYAYHRIAVREPMVMSMILASTASEIRRVRLYDRDSSARGPIAIDDLSDVDGRRHYGRALSGLREALKQDVKSAAKTEAIFITLWLMIDYENRFGSGATAINIHIRGIQTLLSNHVVPLLKHHEPTPSSAITPADAAAGSTSPCYPPMTGLTDSQASTDLSSNDRLRSTSVPLFLLWTLYFFTPGALFCGPGTARIDADLFRFFLRAESDEDLSLRELYTISRQSPARFWGETYPATAQLDDLENLPGLTLYHRSHVVQFKITELYKQGTPRTGCPYTRIMEEILTIADEYDLLLTTAKSAPSCEIVPPNRRVLETIYWASITFYSTIVCFHLCFHDILPSPPVPSRFPSLASSVSQVLELALKLHRSRPRLMVRIVWPLFVAGIATPDQIYQDWVSIQLKELGRYGENFTRVSGRFDEIVKGEGDLFGWGEWLNKDENEEEEEEEEEDEEGGCRRVLEEKAVCLERETTLRIGPRDRWNWKKKKRQITAPEISSNGSDDNGQDY